MSETAIEGLDRRHYNIFVCSSKFYSSGLNYRQLSKPITNHIIQKGSKSPIDKHPKIAVIYVIGIREKARFTQSNATYPDPKIPSPPQRQSSKSNLEKVNFFI